MARGLEELMPSLRDRTFDKTAWIRLALVLGVLGAIGGGVYLSTVAHHEFVQKPRMLKSRHAEPVGTPGMATTQITKMGAEAVPVLLQDVKPDRPLLERQKSLEMLSAIDDPRVLPELVKALNEADIGMRLAAMGGLARRGKADAFKPLWALKDAESDLLRQRVYVALGLVADDTQLGTLMDEADRLAGADRYLLYWAAGQAQRRADAAGKGEYARPVPAPIPEDDAGERKLAGEIAEIKAKIDSKDGKREDLAKELARLTAVDFTTWNFSKQIAHQTIAIGGPGAIRGLARIERDPKAPAHYEPLKLDKNARKKADPQAAPL